MQNIPPDTLVCALSGINGPADVKAYHSNGVGAVLVGEALMRAKNPHEFAKQLLGSPEEDQSQRNKQKLLVKICGTRTPEAADAAIKEGADMIGIILVQGRKRCVSTPAALAIADVVHRSKTSDDNIRKLYTSAEPTDLFEHTASFFRSNNRALLVGVFQDQPLSYILEQQKLLGLDVVQLHGSEPIEWASLIPVPVIRRFGSSDIALGRRGYHVLPLLDSASGGTGERLDLDPIRTALGKDDGLRVILAGGLSPENVRATLAELSGCAKQVVAVDVSSGVEGGGVQDIDKIRKFIRAAKSIK